MDYKDLTAKQALEIAELKEQVVEYKERVDRIHCALYCIGSPLNDSKIKYSREQLQPFFEIAQYIEE